MTDNISGEIQEELITTARQELEERGKHLLFMVLSGSHIWGLSNPDSDYDIRGVYKDRTINLLGISKPKDTVEFTVGKIDGQFYEVEKFLRMLCNHNGNMITILLSPIKLYSTLSLPWVGLAQNFLTRKLRYYYRGYAMGQRKRALSERGGKALIYTYREMFAGLYLMHYGNMEFSFDALVETAKGHDWYDGYLLDKYYPDYKKEVSEEEWNKFYAEWDRLADRLDVEATNSPLPETYDGWVECSQLLKQLRLYDLFHWGKVANVT